MTRLENTELTLSMSVRGLEDMLTHLGKQPFNDVANIIVDLRTQANQQLQKMQEQAQGQAMPQRINGEDRAVA